jgi:hypothetical protein
VECQHAQLDDLNCAGAAGWVLEYAAFDLNEGWNVVVECRFDSWVEYDLSQVSLKIFYYLP